MKRIALLLYLSLATFFCNGQNFTDTVLQRYRAYIIITADKKSYEAGMTAIPIQLSQINLSSKNETELKGRIAGLLQSTRDVTVAWADQNSTLYHNDSVLALIDRSLDIFFAYAEKNTKWSLSQWEVGRNMGDIAILMREGLSSARYKQCVDLLRLHRLQGKASGADIALNNELGMQYGALVNDTLLIRSCRDVIVQNVAITDKDGIQSDLSFHRGGNRLDMYSAGRNFVTDHIRVAWQLHHTPWEFPKDKLRILTEMIADSWQWMARGVYTVPVTLADEALKENALNTADIRSQIPFLAELYPEKEHDLKLLQKWQSNESSHLSELNANHYWPQSDFTAYHHSNFSFFAKSISDRTLSVVSEDHTNVKGDLLGSGDAYFVRDGMEYFNMMQVWDWRYLPGTTSFDNAKNVLGQDQSGTVTNGKSSLIAMRLLAKDSLQKQHLTAQKFWAIHDGVVMSLTGNINGSIRGNAFTTLDQCRWRGDVTVSKPGNILKAGSYELKNPGWIHHAGFVYITIPYYPTSWKLEVKQANGNWADVNRSQANKPVTENVFHLRVDHGHLTKEAYAGYVVAHAESPAQAQSIASKPRWDIWENSATGQVVHFHDGTVMAAFYTADLVENKKDSFLLEASEPCLILIEDGKLYVSDFSFAGKSIRIRWNNQVYQVQAPPGGVTLEAQYPNEMETK